MFVAKYFGNVHCTENPMYVFPEMKLSGLVPSSYIHVSVSDLYFPTLQISLDLCIPEKELAKTRSQISFIYFQSHS
jgi:hypothetical protein